MANGEKELEVGRKELTLDRPPSLASPASSPQNAKKPAPDVDGNTKNEVHTSLSVSNDDLIEKLKCRDENEQIFRDVNKHSVCNDIPLDISNTVENINKDESNSTGSLLDGNVNDNHYVQETVPATENPSSQKSFVKKVHYFHGKPLVSCLKSHTRLKREGNGENDDERNNSKKCVHFPQEDDYVKEFIDPVDPWRDVRTPSKGEVVSFYRNSCNKQRTKPIDKVIKQIQEISDLSQCTNTLILRGSRLDNHSCEALESVFRRVQFENLDLENCNLEEDGATAILEMIEFYHSTCKLNIACNPKIGMRGWQALCRMLRKTPCLTYLDARRTLLTDMTMPTFGRCLKADPPLKILHLESVFLSGRPMLILTTAMKYNKVLEELYLGDNDLTSSDGSPLGAMLTYNTTLQLLDLRNNQIKDVGLAHICNGLSDQADQNFGGLCSLILWNNGLTHEGMTYLNEGLVHTSSLKALNLGHNRIGDLGVQKLKIGLIKNKSLHKLGFLNTKLGSEGAVALAEVLADSLSITRIDIRENNIQTAGLMAFSMALKVNESLLRLDLDKDIRKEPGMEQVMQTVLVDIYNYCHRNKEIARRSLQSSISSASEAMSLIRQGSTESEFNDCHIISDDVFHPEDGKQSVIPFSPVYTDQSQMTLKYNPNSKESQPQHTQQQKEGTQQQTSKKNDNKRQNSQPATEKELISAISSSPSSIPKEPAVHILNKPPLNSSERRGTNRFSVTKILDSLGSHAAGVANKLANVANMDNKMKKQTPKDDLSKVVDTSDKQEKETPQPMGGLADPTTPAITKDSVFTVETSKTQDTNVSNYPTRDGALNSPIEIINVDDPGISQSLGLSPVLSPDNASQPSEGVKLEMVDKQHDIKTDGSESGICINNIKISDSGKSTEVEIAEIKSNVIINDSLGNIVNVEFNNDHTDSLDQLSNADIEKVDDTYMHQQDKSVFTEDDKNNGISALNEAGVSEQQEKRVNNGNQIIRETGETSIVSLTEDCPDAMVNTEEIHASILTTGSQPIAVDLPS